MFVGTRKYGKGNFCQMEEIKTKSGAAWCCSQIFGTFSIKSMERKYKTIADCAWRHFGGFVAQR